MQAGVQRRDRRQSRTRPALVTGDRGEPGFRIARNRPVVQRPQRGEKDLLGCVLCLVPVAQQAEADRAHALAVLLRAALELLPGFAATILNGGHRRIANYARLPVSDYSVAAARRSSGVPAPTA